MADAGHDENGNELDVILHVAGGALFELEVWAGSFGSERHAAPPDPDRVTLRPTASR